ncbi:hypothetical protein GCM10010305_08060 [Streptomyces termitum]|uniref:Uncharacterized protein n=1 Tax=Streptomyces termitum TaxID=67368 RepID=A0A918SRX9_9ACTN|nr:hypothetical protein GCM10010305_08060 [Streptomyces termitum]
MLLSAVRAHTPGVKKPVGGTEESSVPPTGLDTGMPGCGQASRPAASRISSWTESALREGAG